MSSWQVGLYVAAVLIPLAAFVIEAVFIRFLGKMNAYVATAAIGLSFLLSLVGFVDYFFVEARGVFAGHHAAADAEPEPEQMLEHGKAAESAPAHEHEHRPGPLVWRE